MHFISNLSLHHISYSLPNGRALFRDLTLSFGPGKTGLIGRNGTGKSSLLKLLIGESEPTSGSVERLGQIAYCPQNHDDLMDLSVATILGVEEKRQALARIMNGSTEIEDYEILGEDWQIHDRIAQELSQFGLSHDSDVWQLGNTNFSTVTQNDL